MKIRNCHQRKKLQQKMNMNEESITIIKYIPSIITMVPNDVARWQRWPHCFREQRQRSKQNVT